MFKGIGLKRVSAAVLVFFFWFCIGPQYSLGRQAPADPGDKLEQGKKSFEIGDYEASIRLLEEYIADPASSRETRAEAYYFLARNYDAVDPSRVKEMLLKVFEIDGFFTFDEKDTYFKKILEETRREYIAAIPADRYLERAETAFERGEYDESQYLYRLVFEKLPSKTFEKQIERCDLARAGKREALEQYGKKQFQKAYIALKELLRSSPGDERVKAVVREIETQKINPMIEAGDGHFNRENYKEALPFYKEVLTLIPGNREVQEKLGTCLRKLEEKAGEDKTIVKEGQKKRKKRKKFPILPVLLGVAALVAIYFIFAKKKERVPETGSINVQSTPGGAAIWLDNQNTGRVTNAVLAAVAPGSHTLKLVKDGYLDYQVTVTVQAGAETVISATLEISPTPDFVTNTDTVVVPEGGQNTFQVRLSEAPSSEVSAVVSWVSGDSDISVISGDSLTFTASNWNTYQAVTLGAVEDDDTENGEATFRVSASGIADKDVIAMEQDLGSSGELSVSPSGDFSSSGVEGGPFSPVSKTYILQNVGSGSIEWTASNSGVWVSLSDSGGTLEGGSSTTVVVSVNENANALTEGTYSDTVLFINTTNGNGTTTRAVSLGVASGDQADPVVLIQSPLEGAAVSGVVVIEVDASDDRGIDRVEVYIDDVLMGTLMVSPYTYNWDSTVVVDGAHVIKVIAYDTAGKTAEAEVTVTVSNGSGA